MATTIIALADSDDDGAVIVSKVGKPKARRVTLDHKNFFLSDSDDDSDDDWMLPITLKRPNISKNKNKNRNMSSRIDSQFQISSPVERPKSHRLTVDNILLSDSDDDDDDNMRLLDFLKRPNNSKSQDKKRKTSSRIDSQPKTSSTVQHDDDLMLLNSLKRHKKNNGNNKGHNTSNMSDSQPQKKLKTECKIKREMLAPHSRPKASSLGSEPAQAVERLGSDPVQVVERRQKRGYVEYKICGHGWKRVKEMTKQELQAKRCFLKAEEYHRKFLKGKADALAECASTGNFDRMTQILATFTYEQLEPYLCESINRANIYESEDIGDWGNTKDTMYFYEDTPLIRAVRQSNLEAVHALLSTGLCDPTLTSTNWDCMDGYTVPASHQWTALRVCNDGIQNPNKEKIRALLQVALKAWPEAAYSSPDAKSCGRFCQDSRRRKKYCNRMKLVGIGKCDQRQMREVLQRELRHAMSAMI